MVRGNNVRFSTLQSSGNAEQAYDIRIIGVEELSGDKLVRLVQSQALLTNNRDIPSICSVDSNPVNGSRIISKVLNMTEHMATTILRDKIAKVGTKPHVCHGRLVSPPFLDREALEQDEAFAIEDL